jgi:monoamine oxidase
MSLHGGNDSVIERGAEFVLHGYDLLRRLVAEYDLRLIDTGMSYYLREPSGAGTVNAAAMTAAGAKLTESARRGQGSSVSDVLTGLAAPADLVEAIRCRIEISCALEAGRLDSRVLEHVASLAPLPSHRIAGGNQRLALALAARLGNRLHLNSPVRSVGIDGERCVVRTDVAAFDVDCVVLAIPLPVLRELSVSPPFPTWKRDALARTAYGDAAKLHIPLSIPVPTSAVMSVPDRYWSWTAMDDTGKVSPILNCFAGSATALRKLAVEQGPSAWVARVIERQPDMPVVPEDALLTTWADDPWARGAYSAQGSQAQENDVKDLGRRVGIVHFAGEYLGGDFAGLMEGALRSGRKAAAEVLARHRRHFPNSADGSSGPDA